MPDYDDYVAETAFMQDYLAYQERWSRDVRESDRVLIRLASEAVERARARNPRPTILDVGCSTGNLLRHLSAAISDVELVGAEYSPDSLETCRVAPDLAHVRFERMDITDLTEANVADVVIVNAVLYLLDDEQFKTSIQGLGRALRAGGTLLVFDFFHDFHQDLSIIERSRSHPDGLPLHFRRMQDVDELLMASGFSQADFAPFEIPIDLPQGKTVGTNESGFEDLNSYTVRTDNGRRLLFRGSLYQPWCHLAARRGD